MIFTKDSKIYHLFRSKISKIGRAPDFCRNTSACPQICKTPPPRFRNLKTPPPPIHTHSHPLQTHAEGEPNFLFVSFRRCILVETNATQLSHTHTHTHIHNTHTHTHNTHTQYTHNTHTQYTLTYTHQNFPFVSFRGCILWKPTLRREMCGVYV